MTDYFNTLLPEEKLLLRLCRLEFTKLQKEEISSLVSQVNDWGKFVTLSNEHGIIALCWYNLNELGQGKVLPGECMEKLHHGYLKSLARNTNIYKLLDDVLELAGQNKINVVLLKGLALEKTIYGNKGLRQMNDLDIYLRKDQAELFQNILLINGFSELLAGTEFNKKIMLKQSDHLPSLIKNGILLETHFRIFNEESDFLNEKFYKKALDFPSDLTGTYYPDAQLFFLYLVKHICKHEKGGLYQLRLYVDLFLLLSVNLDYIINKQLFEYALKANIEDAVNEKLIIMKAFWGLSMPEWIKSFTININPEKINNKFINILRKISLTSGNPLDPLKYIPGKINKFFFIFGLLFPSFKYMKYRYNAKTMVGAILRYPMRWSRMAKLIFGGRR